MTVGRDQTDFLAYENDCHSRKSMEATKVYMYGRSKDMGHHAIYILVNSGGAFEDDSQITSVLEGKNLLFILIPAVNIKSLCLPLGKEGK